MACWLAGHAGARRASRSSSPVLAFSLRTSAVQPSIKLQVGQFNKRQLINMTCCCCCTATGQTQTDQQRANGPAVWPASPSPCLTHHQPMALPQFGGPLSLVLDPRRERAAPAQPTHPACCLTHQLTNSPSVCPGVGVHRLLSLPVNIGLWAPESRQKATTTHHSTP